MKPILLLAAAFAVTPTFAQDRFQSQSVSDFTGRSWSGIELGQTTWRALSRNHDARAYNIHDAALRIVPQNRERLNIFALFAEKSEEARVEAIRLDYYGDEPSLADMERSMRETGVEMWHAARNSDWSAIAYRRSGVIAIVKGSGNERKAATYFLVSPSRMDAILAPFTLNSGGRQSVGDLIGGSRDRDRDRDRDDDRDRNRSDYATFGRITIDLRADGNTPRGLGSQDMREMRTWAEDRFRRDNSGEMRFEDRSLGTVRFTARWKDFGRDSDEGDLEIEAVFTSRNGENVEAKDTHRVSINGNYERAWQGAVDNVMRQLEVETGRQFTGRGNNGRGDNGRGDNGRGNGRNDDQLSRYDRSITLSEALDELARVAVGRTDSIRGGRITGRGGN